MKSKIGLLFFCFFALSLCAHSQSDSSWFSVKIINHSQKWLYISFLELNDSVGPGRVIDFRKKITNIYFPFPCIFILRSMSADSKYLYEYILSDTINRTIYISKNDEISFNSNYSEKLVEYYEANHVDSNIYKVSDSIMNLNLNDIAAAAILKRAYCKYEIATDSILERYERLSKSVKKSMIGKNILEYIASRNRLKENNFFADFSLPDSSLKKINLSDIKSDYVLLDFWFSRCVPCIEAFPDLIKFYQKTNRQKFQVVGLSVDGQPQFELWKSTLAKQNVPWISLLDIDYKIYAKYGVGIFPTTVLLDRNHKIIKIDPTISDLENIILQ